MSALLLKGYDDIIAHLNGGRNPGSHRKIQHAVYSVFGVDSNGDQYAGWQYHKTIIGAIYPDGRYYIGNGGWYSKTSLRNINDFLHHIESPWRVEKEIGRYRWWLNHHNADLIRAEHDFGRFIREKWFTADHHIDDTQFVFYMPNQKVIDLTSKGHGQWFGYNTRYEKYDRIRTLAEDMESL